MAFEKEAKGGFFSKFINLSKSHEEPEVSSSESVAEIIPSINVEETLSKLDTHVTQLVSEETGTISVAIGGLLKRHLKPETLEKLLVNELLPKGEEESEKKKLLPQLLHRLRKDEQNGRE